MRYDFIFITAALACLLTGMSMGIWMGIAHDFTLSPVHAHLNLLGWVTLALYGLIHRAYPALAQSRAALPQCVLAIAASLTMPAGIALSILAQQPIVAIVASLFLLIATATFATMFVRRARATA
jgi:hypothetical protein